MAQVDGILPRGRQQATYLAYTLNGMPADGLVTHKARRSTVGMVFT